MADETIGIEIQVSTAAAVSETKKLTGAIVESTTAAKGAGTEQQKLGKSVAETKARQQEATEALRRAKEAQQEHNLTVQAFGVKSREAAESNKKLAQSNEESKRAAVAAARALGEVAREAQQAAKAEGDQLSPATKRAAAAIEAMGKDAAKAENELRRLDLSITAAAKAAEKGSKSWSAAFSSFAGNLGANAVGAVTDKLKEGVGWVLQTGASYETLRVALETTTGSSAKAASEFERLQKFAAATPYGVAEVTEAFIKLGNRGIEPTDRALTAFGNTASAMGKTLDDYVEAVADAVTGENERLKEFGIAGKMAGDKVIYTFRGVSTEVGRNAKEIQEYLTRIGEVNFAGGMERQSKTLAGLWSTMLDNASALADEFTQGLAPALKEIMEGFGGVDEEGRSWAKGLGEDVGEALKAFVDIMGTLKDTLSGDNGVIAQFGLLGGAALALLGPFGAAAAAGALIGVKLAESWDAVPPGMKAMLAKADKIDAAARKAALEEQKAELDGMTAEIARFNSVNERTEDLTRRWTAAMEARGKKQAEIEKAAIGFRQATRGENRMLGGGTQEDRLASWEQQTAKLEKENEFESLKGDKSLSRSEKKRMKELAGDLDIDMPKNGKKGKKGPKDPTKGARDQMDFDSQVDTFAAKQEKAQGKAFAKEAEERQKAAEEAFEGESSMREARLTGIDREIEAMDAMGQAQSQQVDLIFWQLDVESEAEARRAELQDERIKREEALARWQVKNAKTAEQREKATSRVSEVEHKKRLLVIERTHASEAKEQAKKVKLFETLSGSMIQLGGTLVDAIEAQAAGEKGAIAESVANFAKGVRNKMILKALEETALGVASLAGIVTAGLAGPHFAAAGLAAAAAVAAGGAAAGMHAVAKSQGFGSEDKAGGKAGASVPGGGGGAGGGGIHNTGGGGGSSSSSGGSSEVPQSYNDGLQHTGRMAKATGGSGTVNITVLGGSAEQVGVALKKIDRNTQRSLGTAAGRR